MPDKKFYTSTQISAKWEKTTLRNKIGILMEALDYMQQFNGRSKFHCIAMAMGYDNYEGESNTYFKKSES